MKRFILSLFMVLLLSTAAWSALGPQAQVKVMVDTVLATLSRTDLAMADKRQQVSGQVQRHLNIRSMSQRTLGVHWKKASVEQRDRFAGLFVQILEETYLNRIEDYSGGEVEYLKERVKGKKAIIDTQFVSSKVTIPVKYKMVRAKGEWQIYDVVIEGVSLIRNYRSSYGEIVRKEGFDGLFARIEKKLVAMRSGEGK